MRSDTSFSRDMKNSFCFMGVSPSTSQAFHTGRVPNLLLIIIRFTCADSWQGSGFSLGFSMTYRDLKLCQSVRVLEKLALKN